MSTNIILETKFVADISGSFYIPSYQRGYRWSETEVVRLLDDIYQNGKKNYCLQPVVVRKKEDRYELIDGQQRLTTLYLIYKYMKNVNPFFNEPAFTLSYQTRDQSEKFLKTLDMTKQDDNIDFWFIAKAYNTIKEWFEQDLQIRVMHIFEYLKICRSLESIIHKSSLTRLNRLKNSGFGSGEWSGKRKNGNGWENCMRTAMVVLPLSPDIQMAAHRMV